MTRPTVDIDNITYEVRTDSSDESMYYIRSGVPFTSYKTDSMSYFQIMVVARSMRQLGFTVIDRSI